LPTTRSSSKSHLFPTNTIGTSSVSCTQDTSLQIKYFAVGQIMIEFQVRCSLNSYCAIIHVKWWGGKEQHFKDTPVPRASGLTLTMERQPITDAAYSPRLFSKLSSWQKLKYTVSAIKFHSNMGKSHH
jgi:hypothetical protein